MVPRRPTMAARIRADVAQLRSPYLSQSDVTALREALQEACGVLHVAHTPPECPVDWLVTFMAALEQALAAVGSTGGTPKAKIWASLAIIPPQTGN